MKIRVFDVIQECYYKGEWVHTIPAFKHPTKEEVEKYYEITEDDKDFTRIMKSVHLDRIILQRDNGHYIIFPRTPLYKIETL